MPTMDGYEMMIGDEVYHLTIGQGKVSKIHPDRVDIDFQGALRTRRTNLDTQELALENPRLLFWSKPEITPPAKTKNVAKYRWAVRTEMYEMQITNSFYATAKEVAAAYGVDEADCERVEMSKEIT